MIKGNKIVSLFSGCGGLDLGFKKAGYNIVFATDYAKHVKETYENNHSMKININDIRELDYDKIPDCDGIIGGPPCQSWSLAGNQKGTDDERGAVFYNYIDVIKHKQPKFFVAENVPGIISKRNIDEFEKIINEFEKIGYNVKYKKMNSAYYNVPQSRKRVIIVGIKKDINYKYTFPSGTSQPMVQSESIKNMPNSKPTKKEPHTRKELNLPNHEHYIGSYSSRYMSRNRVRDWNEPGYTVQANARHQKIHPQAPKMIKIEKDNWKFKDGYEDKYRRYSVREAAKLQSFPDDFIFEYDCIQDGYKMVGNAVPVNLAKTIAESIDIGGNENNENEKVLTECD